MADHPEHERRETEDFRGDDLLRFLVHIANQHGMSFGVTLATPAGFVTGTLVGGDKFFEQVSRSAREAGGNAAEMFGQILERWGEEGYQTGQADEQPEDEAERQRLFEERIHAVQYIHLVDANFYPGATPLVSEGTPWRGRLETIAGWTLGTISLPTER